ncbi:MAG: hypothetical protein ACREJ3_10490, partial [Polyangiaceae bacterium]
ASNARSRMATIPAEEPSARRSDLDRGLLGSLLDDAATTEVHVARYDRVIVVTSGKASVATVGFASEEALAQAIGRLVAQSGDPVDARESIVERRIGSGAFMVAVAPPIVQGWTVSIRKRRRMQMSLSDLIGEHAMSPAMGGYLEKRVAERANILVAGAAKAGVSRALAALASVTRAGERIALLAEPDQIVAAPAIVIPLWAGKTGREGEEAVRAASRLATERLIVASLSGSVAAATIDAIGAGMAGVMAGVVAPSLSRALARLATQVAMARPGTTVETAREAVGDSFAVALEVSGDEDRGTPRILRIAEVTGIDAGVVGLKDVFVA